MHGNVLDYLFDPGSFEFYEQLQTSESSSVSSKALVSYIVSKTRTVDSGEI